jgi:hypothetical protein
MSPCCAIAAVTAPAQHHIAASGIRIKYCVSQYQPGKQFAALSEADALCKHQPFVSARRLQAVRARLDSNPAATPATIAPWLEGRDLTEKPKPKGDEVIFYTHTLCPYAHRVHLALLEKACADNGCAVDMHIFPLCI